MVIGKLKGGLGNFLFQIAAGLSTAEDNHTSYAIHENKIMEVHSPIVIYKDNIFRNLSFTRENYSSYYQYDSLNYRKIPYTQNMIVDGYFQSEKYFLNNVKLILDYFSIDSQSLKYLSKKYNDIVSSENTCSIHVRRGNYLDIDLFTKLDMTYYENAMEIIGNTKTFIVFSNDIEWCKNNFKGYNLRFIENEIDINELYLMSLCKDNIIANSSFSWWAAYLNVNPDKKVISPQKWFAHTHPNDDILPENWIKI